MNRLLYVLLAVLVIAAVAIIAGTSVQLPPRMASHFGAHGEVNGWSSRESYELAMIGIVIGVPLALLAGMAWLPRVGICLRKLPNRQYWLAPERRARTFERLAAFASVAGCLLVIFLTAIHLIVIEANASPRPALPTAPFITVMLAFAVAMIVWAVAYTYGFRRPG
ncbi:MAG TPA: DUF1648 domain-containing protein [Casimicrobiaceae bacterium]|nr:DUF1648 domain-containing protein [Casimicrobiaceae bacterium]